MEIMARVILDNSCIQLSTEEFREDKTRTIKMKKYFGFHIFFSRTTSTSVSDSKSNLLELCLPLFLCPIEEALKKTNIPQLRTLTTKRSLASWNYHPGGVGVTPVNSAILTHGRTQYPFLRDFFSLQFNSRNATTLLPSIEFCRVTGKNGRSRTQAGRTTIEDQVEQNC